MFNKLALLCWILPLLCSCQAQNDFEVLKIEDVGEPIHFPLPTNTTNFHISGQLEENGVGYVDMETGFFRYLSPDFNYDSLSLPEGYPQQNYNVIPNPNGTYYFLNGENGFLYQLSKNGPVLLDSLNNRQPLKDSRLAVSCLLNVFVLASFSDETHLIIPLSLNYNNLGKHARRLEKTSIPVFCEYDLTTQKIRLLNFLIPKKVFKLDYAHQEFNHFGCVNGDTLLISTAYESEVIIYSIGQDKVLGKVNVQSTFQTEPIKEFGYSGTKKEMMKLDRYETETPFYSTMFYNKQRKEYYRVFYHPLPERNADGEFTVFQDKASSILVLDKNLNLKKEILYEKDNFIMFGITSTKRGFIVNTYKKKIDGKMFKYEAVL